MNKKVNEEKIREFFEKKVIDSGHTFEGTINKRLINLGLSVKNEEIYYDKDEKKGRNIDFLAIDNIPSITEKLKQKHDEIQVSGQIRFIIECKSLPNHGWIFFGDEEHESDFAHNSKFSSREMGDTILDLIPDFPEPEIYFASTYSEYIYKDSKEKNKYTKDNNLYESCVSLIKATISNKEEIERYEKYLSHSSIKNKWILGVVFFQPLVIFNGYMYRSTNNKSDDVHLESIDMVKIRRQYVSSNYSITDGTIHIISANKLEEYVNMVKKYYWQGDYIIKHQQELVKTHEDISE